jgi:hypothetical protein
MPWSWDDILNLPWKDIGHGTLDIAGLIPGVGEAADLANAAWYAAEGDYLNAGLSLVSVIPVVGDVIGKGGKLATKLGPDAAAKVLEALQKMDIPKFLEGFKNHPELGPHVAKIEEALKKWQDDLQAQFGKKKAGNPKEDCPNKPPPSPKSRKEILRDKLGKYADMICAAICACKNNAAERRKQECVAKMLTKGWPTYESSDPNLLAEVSYQMVKGKDGSEAGSLIRSEGSRKGAKGPRTTLGGAPAPASVPRALEKGKNLGKGNTVRWDFVLVEDPRKAAELDNLKHIIEVKFDDNWTDNQKKAAKTIIGKKHGSKLVRISPKSCECS